MTVATTRPATLHEVATRAAGQTQQFDPALREFLDEFYARPPDRQRALDQAPPTVDDIKDAYLAATAEHLASAYGLRVPAWTHHHGRPLKKAFFAGGLESLKAILTAESPAAFRRRLLFVGRDALDRPSRRQTGEPGAE